MWEVFYLVIMFAVATEGLQLYLLDRTTRISDLLIDFSAIVFGAILAMIILAVETTSSRKTKPTTGSK